MSIDFTSTERHLIQNALTLYAAELEKTAKAEMKVGIAPHEAMARIAEIVGTDAKEGLIGKIGEQSSLLGDEEAE